MSEETAVAVRGEATLIAAPTSVAVLADCHIHAGQVAWRKGSLDALEGVDLIVTLGDMGEASGLDALEEIAPVTGVRGADDEPDPRTDQPARRLEIDGVVIGCVFDAVRAGLVTRDGDFALAGGFAEAERRLFGGPIDVLLCAGSHRAAEARHGGLLLIDPGSLTLPADETPTFARLTIEAGRCDGRVIRV